MSFQQRQPNYYDYLETCLGENIRKDNAALIASFDANKIDSVKTKFSNDMEHCKSKWGKHVVNRKPASELLLPYDYQPPKAGMFSPALMPSQFNFLANLSLMGTNGDAPNALAIELCNWIKKSLLMCHSIVLPGGIEQLFLQVDRNLSLAKNMGFQTTEREVLQGEKGKIARYLDIIYQFKDLIKKNIVQFVPFSFFANSDDELGFTHVEFRDYVDELIAFAESRENIIIPRTKPFGNSTSTESYFSVGYKEFRRVQWYSHALGTKMCFGQDRWFTLLKTISELTVKDPIDEWLGVDNHPDPTQFTSGVMMRLLSLNVPAIQSLKVADMLAIRNHSDLLNQYRLSLQHALSHRELGDNRDWLAVTSENMNTAKSLFQQVMKKETPLAGLKSDAGVLAFGGLATDGVNLLLRGAQEINDCFANRGIRQAALNHYAVWT